MSSTSAPAKQTFVIWAPDYTDPDAPSRRLAVREKHTEGVKNYVAEGFTSKSNPSIQLRPFVYNDDTLRCVGTEIAGPLSDPESGTMNGSLIIAEAESVAAVRAVMERDIYWSNNVVSPFIFILFFHSILVCSCVLLSLFFFFLVLCDFLWSSSSLFVGLQC
jgi:uncharacterized protein YciI